MDRIRVVIGRRVSCAGGPRAVRGERSAPPHRVAATFIKYAALVIVVLIVAYVVLRALGVLQATF